MLMLLLGSLFFAREAVKERILTMDNLMKRDVIMANRCFLSKNCSETCNHLLLWCPVTYKLWSLVFGLLGISWAIDGSAMSKLLAWEGLSHRNKCFRLIPLIIFWVI